MPVDNHGAEAETWYTRPIFSISDMQRPLLHYCDLLEFEQSWKYEEREQTIVTQVNKGELELILAANIDRVGESRVFVSLNPAELKKLEKLIQNKRIATDRIR